MRRYVCRLCRKEYGMRAEARSHVREVHGIKGRRRGRKGNYVSSPITQAIR